jgi:hypothetical protein
MVPSVRAIERVERRSSPCAKHIALFRRRRPHARFKHRSILRREPDFRRFGYHPNVES